MEPKVPIAVSQLHKVLPRGDRGCVARVVSRPDSVRGAAQLPGRQAVAARRIGEQMVRVASVQLELLAEPPDRDPNVGRIGRVRVGPDLAQQLLRGDSLRHCLLYTSDAAD